VFFFRERGKQGDAGRQANADETGGYAQGGRGGVVLGLGDGSLRFFLIWRAARPRLCSRQRDRPGSCSSANALPQR
jgi:hypothetical protein